MKKNICLCLILGFCFLVSTVHAELTTTTKPCTFNADCASSEFCNSTTSTCNPIEENTLRAEVTTFRCTDSTVCNLTGSACGYCYYYSLGDPAGICYLTPSITPPPLPPVSSSLSYTSFRDSGRRDINQRARYLTNTSPPGTVWTPICRGDNYNRNNCTCTCTSDTDPVCGNGAYCRILNSEDGTVRICGRECNLSNDCLGNIKGTFCTPQGRCGCRKSPATSPTLYATDCVIGSSPRFPDSTLNFGVCVECLPTTAPGGKDPWVQCPPGILCDSTNTCSILITPQCVSNPALCNLCQTCNSIYDPINPSGNGCILQATPTSACCTFWPTYPGCPPPPPAGCGNGVVETGELCDPPGVPHPNCLIGGICGTDCKYCINPLPPCGERLAPCCNGTTCNYANLVCEGGRCQSCGEVTQRCCSGETCNGPSLVCQGAITRTCQRCGEVTQPCCSGGTCNRTSSVCQNGTCQCGWSGQPCCSGETCNFSNLSCQGVIPKTCQPCSILGKPCGTTSFPPCCTGLNCSSTKTCQASPP